MGRKRGNGEGSIRKLSNGKYRLEWLIENRRGSKCFATKREALEFHNKQRHELAQGVKPLQGKYTLGQWLDIYLCDIVQPQCKRSTYENVEQFIRLHVKPDRIGSIRLSELERSHLPAFYKRLAAKGLGLSTMRRCNGILATALNKAMEYGYVQKNVAARFMDYPKGNGVARTEPVALEPDEVRVLLDAARGTQWHALIELSIFTGLRQSEALALMWKDVDLDGSTITIRRALNRHKEFETPKTRAGMRTIGLAQGIVATLRAHKAAQSRIRLASSEWNDMALVFATERPGHSSTGASMSGSPLTTTRVNRVFKQLLAKAGLPDMRWHDLRHTSCSAMARAGVPSHVAMRRMGHTTSKMLQHYTHILDSQDRDAAEKMGAMFG